MHRASTSLVTRTCCGTPCADPSFYLIKSDSLPDAGYLPAPWIHNVTEKQLAADTPSWHAVFALRYTPGCAGCQQALEVVNYVAHKMHTDPDTRSCMSTVQLDRRSDSSLSAAQLLLLDAMKPVGVWIPSLHEQHESHAAVEVRISMLCVFSCGLSQPKA